MKLHRTADDLYPDWCCAELKGGFRCEKPVKVKATYQGVPRGFCGRHAPADVRPPPARPTWKERQAARRLKEAARANA